MISNYQILSAFEIAQFFARHTEKKKKTKRKRKNTCKKCADFSSDDEPKSKRRLFAGLIIGNHSVYSRGADEKIKKKRCHG
jgi:hypothetical protein